jgi:penicillin amidase
MPRTISNTDSVPRAGRSLLCRARRIAFVVLAGLIGLFAALGVTATFALRGSLPRLEGERRLPGLNAPVTVSRDALGVPDIRASDRLDAARALGYLHAQDRFFQMDLQRRAASGELAALLGPALVATDESVRIHRFRDLARRVLAQSPPDQVALLEAYAAGVNAGLDDLRVRPFEYLLLRQRPEPWHPVDTVLTLCSMFCDMSLSTAYIERMSALVADVLPAPLATYLRTPAARWDAPLQEGPPYPATVPDSTQVDLRTRLPETARGAASGGSETGARGDEAAESKPSAAIAGSNSWAVAGSLTAHGGALLANDMHLSLGLPNIWYRARMTWPEGGGERSLVGVTWPGTPALVVGSNGDVAWGFTNSYADAIDLVRLELDPADSTRYRTPTGWDVIERIGEVIEVAGAGPDTLWIRRTRWGPVWSRDAAGAPLVLHWTAHDPAAVNLDISALETASDVDEAVAVAAGAGVPLLNFVCADRSGDIAWTVAGRLPRRIEYDGRLPVSWADGTCRWAGFVNPSKQPKIVRPAEGRLWSANNRMVGGEDLAMLGDGGYGLGARARQIRDDLRALEKPDEADLLAVQLDDRAFYLEEWRRLALTAVAGDTAAARRTFARLVRDDWDGRASVASAGYRLTRAFSHALIEAVYGALTAPVSSQCADFDSKWLSYRSAVAWELVHRRPAHLLPPDDSGGWDALVLAAVDSAMAWATASGRPAAEWTWGKRNTVDIAHPFVRLVPLLRRWLAAPAQALPGDSHMPRVQSPRYGASERLVVSPGREDAAIFQMPGGQSGHPLSPYFLAGHEDWVSGRRTGLNPGAPVHRLTLTP